MTHQDTERKMSNRSKLLDREDGWAQWVALGACVIIVVVGMRLSKVVIGTGPSTELVDWTNWIVTVVGAIAAVVGILEAVPKLAESSLAKQRANLAKQTANQAKQRANLMGEWAHLLEVAERAKVIDPQKERVKQRIEELLNLEK